MALHYLLDGYNIIQQMPSLDFKNLEESRRIFMQLIENDRPQGSPNNAVTVIFDGKPGLWGCGQSYSSLVNVIFAENESADQRIKKMVAGAKNKRNMVVVTDDKDIRFYVRFEGAQLLNVRDFLIRLTPALKRGTAILKRLSQSQGPEDKKFLSQNLEDKITKELEDVWLKEKDQKHR